MVNKTQSLLLLFFSGLLSVLNLYYGHSCVCVCWGWGEGGGSDLTLFLTDIILQESFMGVRCG